jgi:5-methylcytosine-specific restriction endonuclease McrBC GTP-binding regulatory subunit McrB
VKFIILPNVKLEPPAHAQAAKKHPPLSAKMQEFEQWLKENDAFMYGFMQEHGLNALMVQAEYRNFLERQEEALQS